MSHIALHGTTSCDTQPVHHTASDDTAPQGTNKILIAYQTAYQYMYMYMYNKSEVGTGAVQCGYR